MTKLRLRLRSASMRKLMRISRNLGHSMAAFLFVVALMPSSGWAQSYNPATAFEQGFTTQHNPNGVWSYGYSLNFTSPITLYDQTVQNGVNGPNAQYWLSPSVNEGNSPSAEYNDGPAYNDGNVDFLANEFLLVAGIGGQYSNLLFTAPADGVYSVVSAFRGAQYGIGTVVGVVANGTILFNSSVTSVGQLVPFSTTVTLKAGNTLRFSVGPGGGTQNTGLSATITRITFNTLLSFDETNGAYPALTFLVQGTDGNFYGVTGAGGAHGDGTVFKITPDGTLTTLHNFAGPDGSNPAGGLALTTNGIFYGTTVNGGAHGYGTVFKMTSTGTLTTLHSFDLTDGANPYGGLIQATDGNFNGTTQSGGSSGNCSGGCGTVFKITPGGALTTVSLDGADGAAPFAGLVQASDGNFYGITYAGGANNDGVVFKMTMPTGTVTVLHNFDGTDGANSYGPLIQATNGILYGMTAFGGANECNLRGNLVGCGTIFKITLAGALTTLHNFDSTDGAFPSVALIQATDGNFYGTTYQGGTNGVGTIFKFTSGGTLSTLHTFDTTDGISPNTLLQATNGEFYGTTVSGGAHGVGAIFSLSVGLGPFVETLPTSGRVGMPVIILGNNLTHATSVSFNGTAATFKVVSSPEITTTVPTGATTGTVKVPIPSQSSPISTCHWSSGTAACTVASATGFGIGYLLTITGVTPPGYNITGVRISGITGNQISYPVASNPGVYSSGGTASEASVTLKSNLAFRVTPTISSFSPTSGPVGTVVTINGESFIKGATTVTFWGGVKGTITSLSYTKITVTVPSGAETGKITVTTPGGAATSSGTFTVK